jgi:pyruvate/2-oxoglutarate dehydrogenase complex dihydrolipoamide dehydrogenase (E3) component
MTNEDFDAVIIGAGQAGPALAVRCGAQGLKTAIIERKLFGGTCVNTGCVPTKTLIASARAAAMARRAAEYGVVLDQPVRVDMKQVKARKDKIVQQSRTGVSNWLQGAANVTVIEGHARFVAAHEISVNNRRLTAKRIFINAGGRAAVPDIPGIGDVPYLDNTSMMEIDELPEHLMIIGGSYIGLEFAQMYRRFGSRVTVCEMGPRLIGREDEDVSDGVREILEHEGVDVRLNAKCLMVRKRGGRIGVGLECSTGAPEIEGSHLLLAVGRQPNTHDLGLKIAGIKTDKRGYIEVDDSMQTNVPGVWALGDVNGRGAFTHTSWNDYEIVAANLFDSGTRRISDRIPTYALFIDPPLGRAGMTEHEARASGRPLLTAKMPMTRVGRAREVGETQGFLKIIVDGKTKRILGASLLGLNCDEVVHAILDVMYSDQPFTVLQNAVHIHPTVTELIPTLLGGLKPIE